MPEQPEILAKIIAHKKDELVERKRHISEQNMREWAREAPASRGFESALRGAQQAKRPGVIAEIKRASPSRGVLREDFDPMRIAASYQMHGATCISVLTDGHFFKGSCAILELARKVSPLPILRKDFIIDRYQVYETRAVDADCVLLIAAALEDGEMAELNGLARELGLDVLVEVHNREELERALAMEPGLLGINNRDLHSFETTLDTTLELLPEIPASCHVVTESGIQTREDIAQMTEKGVNSFLVGEALMVAEEPGARLRELFF